AGSGSLGAEPRRSRSPESIAVVRASSHLTVRMLRVLSALKPIRRVSQIRQYAPEPVPDDVVHQLLELARWTGSAKNGQPWRFIVVRDKDRLRKLGALRPPINWLASAPL